MAIMQRDQEMKELTIQTLPYIGIALISTSKNINLLKDQFHVKDVDRMPITNILNGVMSVPRTYWI